MANRVFSIEFVGRTGELARLEAALAAAADRSAGCVLIGGESGVGKTRLVEQFTGWARRRGARVLAGGCSQFSAGGLPYEPIVEALRALASEAELLGPARDALAPLLPLEGAPPPRPGDGGGQEQIRLFELFLRLLGRVGEEAPVVLVVEDVQWADRSTLDLVAYVIRNLQHERVLVVATFRGEELPGRPVSSMLLDLDRGRRVERLELAPFGRQELAALLAGILGAPPAPEVAERIFVRSEGNAFFAEELLAAGMGEAGTSLPESVQKVIMTRVQELSPEARDTLGVVAAAGRRVSHRLLQAVSEVPGQALAAALQEVLDRQYLVEDADGEGYTFRHSLVRDAVYRGLRGRRVPLHGAIARAIAEDPSLAGGHGAAAAAALAHHWAAARDLAKALTASVQAGREAARILAFTEAHRQLERALALWDKVPDAAARVDRGELLEETAEVALWAGDADRAVTLVRLALAEVDPARAATRAGVLYQRLGLSLWRQGHPQDALAASAEANRLLAGTGATPERARALGAEGAALMVAARYRESRARSEEAIAVARTIDARREEGYARNTLGVSLTMLGDPEAGIKELRSALAIAEEVGNFEDLFRAYNNLAFALDAAGRIEASAQVALQGLEAARKAGIGPTIGALLLIMATDELLLLGRWREAEELVRDVPWFESGARFGPLLEFSRAQLDLAVGRLEPATAHLEAARQASSHLTDPDFLGPFHACLAEVAIWRDDHAGAQAAVRQGLQRMEGSEAHRMALRLCAVGMRAEADEAERARGAGAPSRVEAARAAGAALLARARTLAPGRAPLPEERALALLHEAEHSRLEGSSDPARWEAAAAAWEDLRQPYRATYARWRQAEALLGREAPAEAAPVLRRAHQAAIEVRAELVRGRLELLAHRSGIELLEPAATQAGNAP